MMVCCHCRRYIPPPRYEDVVTATAPAPFADLFGDADNIFGRVCPQPVAPGHLYAQPAALFSSALPLVHCRLRRQAICWLLHGRQEEYSNLCGCIIATSPFMVNCWSEVQDCLLQEEEAPQNNTRSAF